MAKIFNFAGADHKVGVTMLVESIAEMISEKGNDRNVLVLHLDGREGGEYVQKPSNAPCIDSIFQPLMQHLSNMGEINEIIFDSNNTKILFGSRNNDNCVRYTPEVAQDIINLCKDYFDIILIDSGSTAHWNGLAVGAFEYPCPNILVTTQQKSAYTNFMQKSQEVYIKFDTAWDDLIINKFQFASGHFLKGEKELWVEYGFDRGYSVAMSDAGWQAEADEQTLLMYDKRYKKDIDIIVKNLILG